MLPRTQIFRLTRSVIQVLPLPSRAFMGTHSSEQPSEIFIKKNRHMFRILDATRDGVLNDKDMKAIADRMKFNAKMTDSQADRLQKTILSWWSTNMAIIGKTGGLTEEEYVKMRLQRWNAPEKEAKIFMRPSLEMFFNAIDVNGDGVISSKEWSHFFNAIHLHSKPGEAEDAFRIVDTNKDGKLDFEEFYHHIFDFHYSQVESPSMHMFGKRA